MSEQLNLTDEEIASITGAKRKSTQLARLREMGYHAVERPDGRPLVARAHYLQVMGAGEQTKSQRAEARPDWEAMR